MRVVWRLLLVLFLVQLAQQSLVLAAVGAAITIAVVMTRKVHRQYGRFATPCQKDP